MEPLERILQFSCTLRGMPFTFVTTWGIFSPREVDEGTRLLIDALEVAPDAVVLDVGCGYGALGAYIARNAPAGKVDMIDKDCAAIECAKKNIIKNRLTNCTAYLSNGLNEVAKDRQFDVIVTNLPAQVGKEMHHILIADACEFLQPNGVLWVVTVSRLKEYIKREFQSVFGNYEKVAQGKKYVVAKAVKHI